MKRSKRLKSILELIEGREEEISQKLGQARQRLEKAKQSLNSLHTFLSNYTRQFNESGGQGMGIRQLMEYRAFLAKINGAIEEQERVISKSEADMEQLRLVWEQAHRKTMGVRKVMEKSLEDEMRRLEKSLQSEMDERASRLAAKRQGGEW